MKKQDSFENFETNKVRETLSIDGSFDRTTIVLLSLIAINYFVLIIAHLASLSFGGFYFFLHPFITMLLVYPMNETKKPNKDILFFALMIGSFILVILYQFVKGGLNVYFLFAILLALIGIGVYGFFVFRVTLLKTALSEVKNKNGKIAATMGKIILDVVMIISLYLFTLIVSLVASFLSSGGF